MHNCGIQGVSLAGNCISMSNAVHEIGHAVGFWHEQSRPDRDQYVNVLLNNVIDGKLLICCTLYKWLLYKNWYICYEPGSNWFITPSLYMIATKYMTVDHSSYNNLILKLSQLYFAK